MSAPSWLEERLSRWTAAGLIQPGQAEAIRAHEAGAARPPEAAARAPLAIEAIAYAGAVVALAGLVLVYSTQYAVLGPAGRIGVLAAVTAAAAAAGLLLGRAASEPALRRARAAALGLFVVAAGALTTQVQVELAGVRSGSRIALVSSLVGSVLAAALLAWTGSGLLALVLAVSVYTAGGAATTLLPGPYSPWAIEVVWAVCGAALVAGAELNRRWDRRWAAEVLALTGAAVPVLVAFLVSSPEQLALQLAGGAAALAALAASVLRVSLGYAVAGGVGLFAFVLDIEVRYFANSLGFALTLLVAGLALLGVAFLLARLLPLLHRRRQGAEPT